MAKKATKEKEQQAPIKKTQVLPGVGGTQVRPTQVSATQLAAGIEQWIVEEVDSLSSKSFATEEEAIDCLIKGLGARFSDDSEEFKMFISELIESDPALRSDILSALIVRNK